MLSKKRNALIAIILIVDMALTAFPEMSYGQTQREGEAAEETNISQQVVTEEVAEGDAVTDENTENSTTFDLGGNEKMLVMYGGEVRFEDEDGNLVDYDPELIRVKEEESLTGENIDNYSYENKVSDSKQYMPKTLTEDSPVLMEKDKYSIKMAPVRDEFKSSTVSLEKEETLNAYEQIEEKEVKAIYEDKR